MRFAIGQRTLALLFSVSVNDFSHDLTFAVEMYFFEKHELKDKNKSNNILKNRELLFKHFNKIFYPLQKFLFCKKHYFAKFQFDTKKKL